MSNTCVDLIWWVYAGASNESRCRGLWLYISNVVYGSVINSVPWLSNTCASTTRGQPVHEMHLLIHLWLPGCCPLARQFSQILFSTPSPFISNSSFISIYRSAIFASFILQAVNFGPSVRNVSLCPISLTL